MKILILKSLALILICFGSFDLLIAQQPVKCLTPDIIQALSQTDEPESAIFLQHIHKSITETATTSEYISPSGKFRLVYDLNGEHAVPLADLNSSGVPDFIEVAGIFADSSWNYQVATLGFPDPVMPGSTYEIRFRNITSYGLTFVSGSTTFIVVHHTFEGFPPNTDPEGNALGALKVTIAHEFKHAIQFVTNQWTGDAGSVSWLEMDATLMEEIVHPDVNDYYNYIFGCLGTANCSIFTNPAISTPRAYTHITWMLHFAEKYGMSFWVNVWERIRLSISTPMVTAITQELQLEGVNFKQAFAENHLWHLKSGDYALPDFGFIDRFDYPTPFVLSRNFADGAPTNPESLNRLSARYIELTPLSGNVVSPTITISHSRPDVIAMIIGLRSNGEITTYLGEGSATGLLIIPTELNWIDYEQIFLILGNSSYSGATEFSYRIEAIPLPNTPQLAQNFPNPFNPGTTISFSIPESSHVLLDVYDMTGRRVATLVDENREAGFGYIPFDASGLASGIYIYRLSAGLYTISKKMILVK